LADKPRYCVKYSLLTGNMPLEWRVSQIGIMGGESKEWQLSLTWDNVLSMPIVFAVVTMIVFPNISDIKPKWDCSTDLKSLKMVNLNIFGSIREHRGSYGFFRLNATSHRSTTVLSPPPRVGQSLAVTCTQVDALTETSFVKSQCIHTASTGSIPW
jgi:hypothetical protein